MKFTKTELALIERARKHDGFSSIEFGFRTYTKIRWGTRESAALGNLVKKGYCKIISTRSNYETRNNWNANHWTEVTYQLIKLPEEKDLQKLNLL